MNFKEIVAKVNLHAGLQGSVSSVDSSGYQEYLSEAVRSNWSDLQLQREDWKFMWETADFTTQIGVTEYTNDYIVSDVGYTVAKWKTNTLTRNNVIQTLRPFDEYWNNKEEWETESEPYKFAIREHRDNSLILPSPNSTDEIRADFYRTPQILSGNTTVPLLPVEFHYLIVYKALEDVAAWLGNQAIYERHSYKADILENKLMRSQVPAKKIKRKPFYYSHSNQN